MVTMEMGLWRVAALPKSNLEYLGVEPSASRMLSERSTDELEPLQ
jgi:hypothetical protein